VLAALHAQILPPEYWEMLVIDNASKEPVAPRFEIGWHPHGRHIREDKLGLTHARLCGIGEAKAELLVFVDDDNVLAPNYLIEALQIAIQFPYLGAWSGELIAEYDTPPAEWTKPYHRYLGIRSVPVTLWAMTPMSINPSVPFGAGLCVRSAVANDYVRLCSNESVRRALDRTGQTLISCGDTDLALCACDRGLGVGLFPSLRLHHLMPSSRFTIDYLCRIVEGTEFSLSILRYVREGNIPDPPPRMSFFGCLRYLKRRMLESREHLAISNARNRGVAKARNLIRQLLATTGKPPLSTSLSLANALDP